MNGASPDHYVGLTRDEALRLALMRGRCVRIVRVNNIPAVTTRDFVPTRLNLHLIDDKVTLATLG